jgi:sn-glycerol 3-phosphate transport system ATP-binding protein
MGHIALKKVTKSFGTTQVIPPLDLEINDGEFVVFVGPSGCGKSTLLRLIAGLEDVSGGTIEINGNDATSIPPAKRGLAMVFQSYALYPHMSVRKNIGFPLQMAGLDKAAADKKVEDAASVLNLTDYLERRPGQLSGGQRQRVAIGRAIVREPDAFLFDEPLSNLDAALRVNMRLEISELHNSLKTTMIYVTHDQVEAMTLAQRMVVMNKGVAEQIGTPIEVFDKPASTFVASFIGSPPMNLIPVGIDAERRILGANATPFDISPDLVPATLAGRKAILGMRPEHMRLRKSGVPVEVEMVEVLGSEQLVHGRIGDTQVVVRCPVSSTKDAPVNVGDAFQIGADGVHPLHWFDAETGKRIETD